MAYMGHGNTGITASHNSLIRIIAIQNGDTLVDCTIILPRATEFVMCIINPLTQVSQELYPLASLASVFVHLEIEEEGEEETTEMVFVSIVSKKG